MWAWRSLRSWRARLPFSGFDRLPKKNGKKKREKSSPLEAPAPASASADAEGGLQLIGTSREGPFFLQMESESWSNSAEFPHPVILRRLPLGPTNCSLLAAATPKERWNDWNLTQTGTGVCSLRQSKHFTGVFYRMWLQIVSLPSMRVRKRVRKFNSCLLK